MIHMQVCEEHFGHTAVRDIQRVVIDECALAHVEDEGFVVAEFHENRACRLRPPDNITPAGAQDRDPHLV